MSMRIPLRLLCCSLLAGAPLAFAQPAEPAPHKIILKEIITKKLVINGEPVYRVTLKYTVKPLRADAQNAQYEVIAEENNEEIARKLVPMPKMWEAFSGVVAVDCSGSMAVGRRMEQTRAAAGVLFQKVSANAELGLILFDHEMKVVEPLTRDRHRLAEIILKARPGGGTAYLDATIKGIQMLKGVNHKGKAVVVITDGDDLNSNATVEEVIRQAKKHGVRVYTIGIGEPGRQEKITSVLVLDKSASMALLANDLDTVTKIDALKLAANRFLSFVRQAHPPIVRTSVLEFSDVPGVPMAFTNDRLKLRDRINNLTAGGETALFDAIYEAITALEAERAPGKRMVVALTDGIDNRSRRRVEEVIARAREAKVPLYLLGFGKEGEFDATVMRRMALETGGTFHHARNQQSLMEIFEKLANQIHDDGINEKTLKELAHETGGVYFHARDANQLKFIVDEVAADLQSVDDEITFQSRVPDWGVHVPYALNLARCNDGKIVDKDTGQEVRHGLVVAGLNHFVYLFLLVLFGVFLVLPAGLRRRLKADN
jgi:VWFA-related protein